MVSLLHLLVTGVEPIVERLQSFELGEATELQSALAPEGAEHVLEVKVKPVNFARVREPVIDLLFEWALHEVVAQVRRLLREWHQYKLDVGLVRVLLEQFHGRHAGAQHG